MTEAKNRKLDFLNEKLELLNQREKIYGFSSSETAHNLFEDIINYDTDQSIFTHELNDSIYVGFSQIDLSSYRYEIQR